MAFGLVWKPRAFQEVRDAHSWWLDNRPAARLLLREELARTIALVTENPRVGVSVSRRDARRVALPRTGYLLYYRVRPRAGRIEVIAFVHGHRGAQP